VAANEAVINNEVTSKADDKSGFIGVFGRRGYSAVLFVRILIASVQIILQPPRS
jgi:hypothetical protein